MINFEKQERLYAKVLLQVGLHIHRGQKVCVEASVAIADFVNILNEEALKLGGNGVCVFWRSEKTDRMLMHKGIMPQADAVRQAELEAAEALASQGAAYLKLEAPFFSDNTRIPEELLHRKRLQDMKIRTIFRTKAGGSSQTAACVPCQTWADQVYSYLPEQERLSELWNTVLSCTYSDSENPNAEWQNYIETVTERKRKLDERAYQEFHYFGGKTDFIIKPAMGDFWKGGCVKTSDQISIPNIPTQEIFLTPHKYSAEGHVAASMPVCYDGNLIDGIELDFTNGRITDFRAEKNEDLLKAVIETDEGSRYLGEMALVDQENPIAKKGVLFYTTIYDENAACHLAVGNAIGPPVDSQEREKRGMNCSAVHLDFMVGNEELCIQGKRPDGIWEDILKNGRLVL